MKTLPGLTERQVQALDRLRMIAIISQSTLDLMTFDNEYNATPEAIDELITRNAQSIELDLKTLQKIISQ